MTTKGLSALLDDMLGKDRYYEPSVSELHFVEMLLPDILKQVHPQGWTTEQNINFIKNLYGLGDDFKMTPAELAVHMKISVSTVSTHKRNLLCKLRTRSSEWLKKKVKVREMMHVDEWLDTPSDNRGENYAKFVLNYKRMPAWQQTAFAEWMKPFMLFCEYEGQTYRVTGASRMGDVWLTSNYYQESGYEKRVDIDKCSKWGKTPHPGDIIGG